MVIFTDQSAICAQTYFLNYTLCTAQSACNAMCGSTIVSPVLYPVNL